LGHLGAFTHNKKAAVPWGRINSDPRDWIDNWDEKVSIKEPSKMVAAEIDALYQYLLTRQSQEKSELGWFQKLEKDVIMLSEEDGKGKGKEVMVDSGDTNVEDSDDGTGDLNHDMENEANEGTSSMTHKRGHAAASGKNPTHARKRQKVARENPGLQNTRYVAICKFSHLVH
jgi:hypothetical protein